MTRIILLRHAESTANQSGILAGLTPGVFLSKSGKKQARQVAKALEIETFAALYSSPVERCLETIEPLRKSVKRRVKIDEDFQEMDYGMWSGRKLRELRREPLWKSIQKSPMNVTFPGGESFKSAVRRLERGLNRISKRHPKGQVLVVTHGDPIKLMVQLTIGGDLNDFQRIIVDPASISIIDWPSRALVGSNIPITGNRRKREKKSDKRLSSRRILGGGTNA